MSRNIDENEHLHRLLCAVALGDRAAFRTLYDTSSARLFGFALRILRKDELAEEALQDAFVAIWHAASSYQVHLSAPLTWMATIVRNKALDLRRRMHASMETELAPRDHDLVEALQDAAAGPQERVQLSQDALALAGCMEKLAGRQRQAIGMAYLHDLSHTEVAAQLGQPLGTVKTWIRRGLERLRDCLTKGGAA
ncbi:sigma-70 family RNA polymerase sigma factor [Massilia aerilata]|uniref:Sigma-70 family RNA polymerase sigma factor n=1 Tax=Massilia aerilata TaxID=453817 RepID=A0ABW0RY59_9BURK